MDLHYFYKNNILLQKRSLSLLLIFFVCLFFNSNSFSKPIKDPKIIKENLKKNMKVVKPDGKGPFPTIIMFTGAGDPFWREGYANWMNWFKERGYVSIISDSAKSRNLTGKAMLGRKLMSPERSKEVFWIIEIIKHFNFVDKNNLALMGMSHGGDTVIDSLVMSSEDSSYDLKGTKTVIAFYPGCRKPVFGVKVTKNFTYPWYQKNIPVIIFQGSDDAWVKVKLCQGVVERQKKIGTPIEYHFYNKANHCFDEIYSSPEDVKCKYNKKFSDLAKKEVEKNLKNSFSN